MIARCVSVLVLATLVAAPIVVVAAPAIDLAGHRALYELSMASARGDVTAATGTMAFEVTDACDGWAVHQRLAMTVTNRDGQDIEMLSDYTTYETKDGASMRFRSRQTTEQAVTSEVIGEAEMAADGGTVRYTLPDGVTKRLGKATLFPMAHTEAILKAAMAGKKFIEVPLFDGTGAEGAQDSSVAISAWTGPQAGGALAGAWPDLAALGSARVHVAFFEQAAGAQQPEYEVSMRYFENGVADELLMDFGDFSVRGKMKAFELPKKGC